MNDVVDWLEHRRVVANLRVNSVSLIDLKGWIVKRDQIHHVTNRFFSIVGVKAQVGNRQHIQPLIHQPEIGILGFIFAKSNDEVSLLIQAKTEPGNINGTQIAPTVQATKSNYSRAHNGSPTRFLEYFIQGDELKFDGTLQSEQGTRFLNKYNRNASLFLENKTLNENVDGNWRWVNLRSIFEVIDRDFFINTDARSVLVCSDWIKFSSNGRVFDSDHDFSRKLNSSFFAEHTQSSNSHILESVDKLRKRNKFNLDIVALSELNGWVRDDQCIRNEDYFQVKGFEIAVVGREVTHWFQPLIQSQKEGKVVLYCKEIDGILWFLVQYCTEVGFNNCVQLGPSVQVVDSPEKMTLNLDDVSCKTIAEYRQSDEGGRFYQSCVHYSLVEIESKEEILFTDDCYCWMTIRQIYQLLQYEGLFNNEFRSVLSLIFKFF